MCLHSSNYRQTLKLQSVERLTFCEGPTPPDAKHTSKQTSGRLLRQACVRVRLAAGRIPNRLTTTKGEHEGLVPDSQCKQSCAGSFVRDQYRSSGDITCYHMLLGAYACVVFQTVLLWHLFNTHTFSFPFYNTCGVCCVWHLEQVGHVYIYVQSVAVSSF